MKLFTAIAITAIAFSATVFAATNAKFLQPESNELASLSPGGGSIGKYSMKQSAPAVTLKNYAEASKPDVSKIAQNCQNKADARIKDGVATAASQAVYYNCLNAGLKMDLN